MDIQSIYLQQIQNIDRHVAALKHSCLNGHQGFVIKTGLLYKKGNVLGQFIYKLVLPEGLAKQVLYAIHSKNETHISEGQLSSIFGSTFFTNNLNDLTKRVVRSCILCKICTKPKKIVAGGDTRTYENNQEPGKIWIADVSYLPPDKLKNKFALILAEQVSSCIVIFPLPDLRALTMAAMLRQFLSCFPKPHKLFSDYGSEFSSIFTTELRKYNIAHHEGIPQRSQGQGSAELGVKLVKITLNKMVGMQSNQGRDYWTKLIPHVT